MERTISPLLAISEVVLYMYVQVPIDLEGLDSGVNLKGMLEMNSLQLC